MTPRPVTLSTEVQLSLVVPGAITLPVRARLKYDVYDPYALTVAFHTGGADTSDTVEWTFARQLLMDGVTAPAGQGDVRVWPTTTAGEGIVCLSLCSPSGKALPRLPGHIAYWFAWNNYYGGKGELAKSPPDRR